MKDRFAEPIGRFQPSTLDVGLSTRRPPWIVLILSVPFLATVLDAWAWFNLDVGPRRSTLDAGPLIWLTARTNIPGYTFVSEPVSEAVKECIDLNCQVQRGWA